MPPEVPAHQRGRTNLRIMISMPPETRENLEKIMKQTGLMSFSKAITWAVERAVRDLPEGKPLTPNPDPEETRR